MFRKICFIWLLLTAAASAWSQDYVVKVNGIVCEFCSYGVAKKVSKLPFVDHSRHTKGVDVQVKDQLVVVAVSADARMDKDALFAAIESGGYHPIDLHKINPDGSWSVYQP